MDARDQRAIILAAMTKIDRKDGHWLVPSQSEPNRKYTVTLDGENGYCNCPDHEKGFCCKHVRAVRITLKRELGIDGSIVLALRPWRSRQLRARYCPFSSLSFQESPARFLDCRQLKRRNTTPTTILMPWLVFSENQIKHAKVPG